MARPQKFLFDVSFDQPDEDEADALRKPPEPTYSLADLEAARAAGLAEGSEAASEAARQAAETRTADALEMLARGVTALNDAKAALALEVETHALALLRAVLQKAVPVLCRKNPLAEIEAIVTQCLSEALDEPRLVLRVGDGLFDAVQGRLAAFVQASGYSGKLVLLADAALAEGDARVEWADGGAERDTRRLAAEIDAVLARALVAPPPISSPEEDSPHE